MATVLCDLCGVEHPVVMSWPGAVLVECPKAPPGQITGIDWSYVKTIDAPAQGCDTVTR